MPLLDRTESLELALAKGYFLAALLTQNRFFSLKCHFLSVWCIWFLLLGKAFPNNDLSFVLSIGLHVIIHMPRRMS